MTEAVVVEANPNTGYRFAWPLVFAGSFVAAATTFFLLSLGAGLGLLLVSPASSAKTAVGFFTGGAIYFFAAQAFGFAAGGHVAGRLLGPLIESQTQEDVRAGVHGLAVWAVTVVATATMIALSVVAIGGSTAAMYGISSRTTGVTPADYTIDRLFRPDHAGSIHSGPAAEAAFGEARRILSVTTARGGNIEGGDRERLIGLTAAEAALPQAEASARVDQTISDLSQSLAKARRTAAYTALWIAFSLLFGAIVAVAAAIYARIEDDRATLRPRAQYAAP